MVQTGRSPLGRTQAATGEWECMECGYVVEGVQARRPEECPECSAPSEAFEFFPAEDDEGDIWGLDDEDEYGDDAVAEDLDEEFEDEDDY